MAAAAAGAWNFLDILKIAAPVIADLGNKTGNKALKILGGLATIGGSFANQGSGGQKTDTGTTGKPMESNPDFKGKAQTQGPQVEALKRGWKNNQKQLRIQNEQFKTNQQSRLEIGERNRRIMGQGKSDVRPSSTMNIQETGIVRDEDKDPYRFLSGRTR